MHWPAKQAQKVFWVLRLVKQLDPVPAQYFKKLVDTYSSGKSRVQHGGDTFRLIGFLDGPRFVGLRGWFREEDREDAAAGDRHRVDAPPGL